MQNIHNWQQRYIEKNAGKFDYLALDADDAIDGLVWHNDHVKQSHSMGHIHADLFFQIDIFWMRSITQYKDKTSTKSRSFVLDRRSAV